MSTSTKTAHTPDGAKWLHCEMCGKKHEYPITVISRGIKPDFTTANLCEECRQGSIELVSAAGRAILEVLVAYKLHHKLMLQVADDTDCPCKICQLAEAAIHKAKGEL